MAASSLASGPATRSRSRASTASPTTSPSPDSANISTSSAPSSATARSPTRATYWTSTTSTSGSPPSTPKYPSTPAAVFDKMLRTCGEITDGTILTWTTLSGAANAAKTVAEGARAAGRDPSEVEIADLISTVVSTDSPADLEGIRKATAFYAGFFPRYNRALAQNGFPDEAASIRAAYKEGKRGPALESLVPDSMLRSIAITGNPRRMPGTHPDLPGRRRHPPHNRPPHLRPQRRPKSQSRNPRPRPLTRTRKTARLPGLCYHDLLA